jgi:uracil-DNA glycosylase
VEEDSSQLRISTFVKKQIRLDPNAPPGDEEKRLIMEQKRREAFGRRVMNRLKEETWKERLTPEFQKPYWRSLIDMLFYENQSRTIVFPPEELIFNALNTCPLDNVKVVIIGQDPYHGEGQAMGLSFSVPYGVDIPASLVNIYSELESDIPDFKKPNHGNLTHWANQGVLLLNAVLTVKKASADSHAGKGWEQFTDRVIKIINEKQSKVIFMLWGKKAQVKAKLINDKVHTILTAGHPSPYSATYFFGCKHFSKANEILNQNGITPIDWELERYDPLSPSKKRAREEEDF